LSSPTQAASAFATRPSIETIVRHQASNAVQASGFAFMDQIFMHAWRTDDAFAVFVYLTDTL